MSLRSRTGCYPHCDSCHEAVASKWCANCAAAFYCSRKCQKGDWKRHKALCVHVRSPNCRLGPVQYNMQDLLCLQEHELLNTTCTSSNTSTSTSSSTSTSFNKSVTVSFQQLVSDFLVLADRVEESRQLDKPVDLCAETVIMQSRGPSNENVCHAAVVAILNASRRQHDSAAMQRASTEAATMHIYIYALRWLLDTARMPPNIPDKQGLDALDYVCDASLGNRSREFINVCQVLADLLLCAGCQPRILTDKACTAHELVAAHILRHPAAKAWKLVHSADARGSMSTALIVKLRLYFYWGFLRNVLLLEQSSFTRAQADAPAATTAPATTATDATDTTATDTTASSTASASSTAPATRTTTTHASSAHVTAAWTFVVLRWLCIRRRLTKMMTQVLLDDSMTQPCLLQVRSQPASERASKIAYAWLPHADVLYAQFVGQHGDADSIRRFLCADLHKNAACEMCHLRDLSKLRLCSRCCLAWYCSRMCANKHSLVHRLRCQQRLHGVLDNGVMRLRPILVLKDTAPCL